MRASLATKQQSFNVLLIEDNPGDVELIRELLTEITGTYFQIESAEQLSIGLNMVTQGNYDVLLLDFFLPDSSGLDTLLRLRAEAADIPVVVLTGHSDELGIGIQAIQYGAQDYLIKGQIDSDRLVHTLYYAIERKQLENELNQYRNQLEALVEARTTELAQSNLALQHEVLQRRYIEDKLRQITNNMLDIICQTDAAGLVEYVSPSIQHTLGYKPEELLGQSIYSIIHPDEVETVIAAVQTVGKAECRYRHRDGSYLWMETLNSCLFMETGAVSGIVFASRDVTVRRRAEEELQALNQLKTEFLSTAAHELRTPLTSILGFSEILLTRNMDSARSRHFMEMINEQSVQLRTLVDSLLDIARLESKSRLMLDLQPIRLEPLVQKVVLPWVEVSQKHDFQIDGLAECPSIKGDSFRISQVLQNLVSNAAKYSPSGGKVTLSGQLIPGFVQISVRDEGIGMTEQQMTHLFERFYRADASNTTISGTGLGLAICKLIVELHQGQIWAESEPERGSTFHFTLPSGE